MRRVGLVLALTLGAADCSRSRAPEEVVVARIDGEEVTLDAFQAWMETALPGSATAGEPARGPGEEAEVQSRLFDQFLDEMLLAREAERRGVAVGDDEVRQALGPAEAGSSGDWAERRRAQARIHLAVQKLQAAFLRAEVRVEPAALDAWVARARSTRVPPAGVTLRGLKVASPEEGASLAASIRAGRTTFEEAARAADPDGAPALRVSRAGLPAFVLQALDRIQPGEVTAPVAIQDGVYLFQLVERHEVGTVDEAALREEGLRTLEREDAARRQRMLLDVLRNRSRVERKTDRLPFAYVEPGG